MILPPRPMSHPLQSGDSFGGHLGTSASLSLETRSDGEGELPHPPAAAARPQTLIATMTALSTTRTPALRMA
jgi:hypothetical protein